ncbi:hypothetical protein DKX38_013455 [Salix brachista]|uniref:Dynein light chain n=1 Tax=Salix brachista TaxID=2182728 RepID=A0A5N5LRF9_9ROSI|nr:hypothetical protein DKX38_013455 [Salix brachista]
MNSEDTKRSITGGMKVENDSYYRKSSLAAAPPPGKKIIIKNADMKDDMQKEAVDIAIAAFERNNVEKDVAEHIKKEFDKKHGPTWHCIVGRNFGNPFHFLLICLAAFLVRIDRRQHVIAVRRGCDELWFNGVLIAYQEMWAGIGFEPLI